MNRFISNFIHKMGHSKIPFNIKGGGDGGLKKDIWEWKPKININEFIREKFYWKNRKYRKIKKTMNLYILLKKIKKVKWNSRQVIYSRREGKC